MGGVVTGGMAGGTGGATGATGGTGGAAVDAAKGGGVGAGRRELLPARLMGVPSAR